MLIPYWLRGSDGTDQYAEVVALKQNNGSWKITLDLAANPVASNWMDAVARVQRLPDFMYSVAK